MTVQTTGKQEPRRERPEGAKTQKELADELPIGLFPPQFSQDYVGGAIEPYLLSRRFVGEVPMLPMIDFALNKEHAVPALLLGMLYETWEPDPEREGVSVFIRGYDKRGPENLRKRIYMSATTPDLIQNKYKPKLLGFIDQTLASANAGKPLMQEFYKHYYDFYFDLHLGVRGDAIPRAVRDCGASFNTVVSYNYPTLEIVRENYMRVRETRPVLKKWIDERIQDILDGKVADADRTFAYYWTKNGMNENFRRIDVVFECFHNFVAFSQWGNTVFNVVARLASPSGNAQVRSWFERTMKQGPDRADEGPFTPLDRFVMELFRTISPNGASVSCPERERSALGSVYTMIDTPHLATSTDPRHWVDPEAFNPDRYKQVPTSADDGEKRAKQAGLAKCPFHKGSLAVKDGRNVELTNSGYGAVYAVVDGSPQPIADTAGFAPFGFGYRRCAGEYLTVDFIKEFLKKVWSDKISFVDLELAQPKELPVGPRAVINDKFGFKLPH